MKSNLSKYKVMFIDQDGIGDANFYYDPIWLFALIAILGTGFIMLASASMGVARHHYQNPFYFLTRQTIFLVVAIIISVIIIRIPLLYWQRWSGQLILLSFILLVLVLVPGIGSTINGSSRWLNFRIVSLQVSELVKIAVVLYLASYLVRHYHKLQNFGGFVRPLYILGTLAILLLLEPDFGATVVISATVFGMMYLGGARIIQFMVILLPMAVLLVFAALVSPYRVARIVSFLDPWQQAFGHGYQLTQALIAFGRGGWWGVGLGNSIQKLFYLPEAHTDFLFAIIAEEFGIVGQLVLIGSFLLLIYRTIRVACLAAELNRWFICYMVSGLVLNIGFQVVVNIGVNAGMLPTKGLALPFVSYGGSNLLFNMVGMALVARSYNELAHLQLDNYKQT